MADDITGPVYLTRPELGARRARVLSGKGVESPGYTIIGTQPGAESDGLVVPRVLKMVSPLSGQGPADPRATGRYSGMDASVRTVRIIRQSRAVPPNTGSVVVRPPRNALRRMDTRGQGTVGYV
jgi:hypothetical protein